MQETENSILVEDNDVDSRVYELGYLLVPSIKEEDVPAAYGNLKEVVMQMKGDVISDEMPKLMTLAYPMTKVVSNVRSKWSTAYFGWIKFTMDPVSVLNLKKHLDLDPNLVRFLLLKTVKENTIAAKRFIRGEGEYRKPIVKKTSNEAAVPINKEEVDKEIEALIAA